MIEEEWMDGVSTVFEEERLAKLRESEACGYGGEHPYSRQTNLLFTPDEIRALKRLAARYFAEKHLVGNPPDFESDEIIYEKLNRRDIDG